MSRRILLAVEGSTTSKAAIRAALELARESGVRLRVAHVIDSPYDYPDEGQAPDAGDDREGARGRRVPRRPGEEARVMETPARDELLARAKAPPGKPLNPPARDGVS